MVRSTKQRSINSCCCCSIIKRCHSPSFNFRFRSNSCPSTIIMVTPSYCSSLIRYISSSFRSCYNSIIKQCRYCFLFSCSKHCWFKLNRFSPIKCCYYIWYYYTSLILECTSHWIFLCFIISCLRFSPRWKQRLSPSYSCFNCSLRIIQHTIRCPSKLSHISPIWILHICW
jgi:hypothetical protein